MAEDKFTGLESCDPLIVVDITYCENPSTTVDSLIGEIGELRDSYNRQLNELRECYFEQISSRLEMIKEVSQRESFT